MKDEIADRFERNLERVRGLIGLYDDQLDERGKSGRPAIQTTDALRASVVFLHATLEDVLRSVLEWRLPSAAPSHLEDIPLVGCGDRPRFTLGDLAAQRGKTVEAVLTESVSAHLARSTYNNVGDIARALGRIGITDAVLVPFKQRLAPMMARRHWIVHRADRNEMSGRGQHAALSLAPKTVITWRDAVQQFCRALLAAL